MLKQIARKLRFAGKRHTGPRLSVIVICYKMDGQIGNTLRSLLPPYQRKIKKSEYEILLVDNGSPKSLPEETWKIASSTAISASRRARRRPIPASPSTGQCEWRRARPSVS